MQAVFNLRARYGLAFRFPDLMRCIMSVADVRPPTRFYVGRADPLCDWWSHAPIRGHSVLAQALWSQAVFRLPAYKMEFRISGDGLDRNAARSTLGPHKQAALARHKRAVVARNRQVVEVQRTRFVAQLRFLR